MKDEIKVGDYIRTKQWGIAKVHMIENGEVTMIKNRNNRVTHYFTQLKEPSSNILDLIEEGDILKVKDKDIVLYVGIEKDDGELTHQAILDEIKNKDFELLSIITKEQSKSVEYEV